MPILSQLKTKFKSKVYFAFWNDVCIAFSAIQVQKCPHCWKPRSSCQSHFLFEMATSLNSALAGFRKCASGRQRVTQLFQGLEINMENNMGPQDVCRSWCGWDGGWEIEKHHSHGPWRARLPLPSCPAASRCWVCCRLSYSWRNRQAVGQALTNGLQGWHC